MTCSVQAPPRAAGGVNEKTFEGVVPYKIPPLPITRTDSGEAVSPAPPKLHMTFSVQESPLDSGAVNENTVPAPEPIAPPS